MAQLNIYSLYSMNSNQKELLKEDEVDLILEKFKSIQELDEVRAIVEETFHIKEGIQWFDYSNDKKVSVVIDEEKIEICALKNDKQYYGKGWKKIQLK